jgi:hypothetical protein
MTVRLPDRDASSVLLIGTSRYASNDLLDLPAVHNNLQGLARALTHPQHGGVQAANCRIIHQPASPAMISKAVRELARTADDTLIVYFAGHGIAGGNSGDLFLALPESDPEDPAFSALRYDDLRNLLVADGAVHARNRVVILDCCFSGRAIPAMSAAQVGGLMDIEGVYVLTATARNQPALAPEGEQYTAFSGALLELLRYGIADGPELLSLAVIHERLNNVLRARGLPRPEQINYRTAARLALTRNPAYRQPFFTQPAATTEDARSRPNQPSPRLPRLTPPTDPRRVNPSSEPRATVPMPLVEAQAALPDDQELYRSDQQSAVRRLTFPAIVFRILLLIGVATFNVWMAMAHGVGWIVRLGDARRARAERRRDGSGLTVIAVAILLAAVLWFDTSGFVTSWLATMLPLAFGHFAAVLPILLIVAAVVLMRSSPAEGSRGRATVGWITLFLGVTGLLHIAAGSPSDGADLHEAGGLLGRAVGGTLATVATPWIAVPLLAVLTLFSLLVLTSTPINRIPDRWWQLHDFILSRIEDRAYYNAPQRTEDYEPSPRGDGEGPQGS